MSYITSSNEQHLKFVLCAYDNKMIYHDYNHKTDELSAGKMLTVDAAKTLFKFSNEINSMKQYEFNGIIPSNVLRFKTDEKYIIWETEPGIKEILYHESLPVKSGKYWVPRMIWKLNANSLSVHAIMKEVKSEKDKLYNAPFFNVSKGGSVCMGNTKFTDQGYNYEKIMKKVEEGFWGSVFTHSNNDALLHFNFVEWCNNPKLNQMQCNDLLVDSEKTIKSIL
jgi:PRTRC genetic system protein B